MYSASLVFFCFNEYTRTYYLKKKAMTDQIETFDDLVNRRQYFRVVDNVSIEIAKIDEQHLAAEQFELLPEFGLISEFQLLDVESKHLLRALTDKDKNLGQFLKIMNKKLDALARVISLNHQVIPRESIVEVNLSEGGLSLPTQQYFEKGNKLALKLVLLPNYSGLLLEGRVLSCSKTENHFTLHIEFLDISEPHQQLIARHIMRIQSQQMHPAT
jgi:hypothetical protein